MKMECRLYSCSDNDLQIVIPDKKKIILGRGPRTKIKERKCSREQVELTADYDSREIELKQIGTNPSAIGSTLLKQGDVHLLGPGSVFSFLQGKHNFVVQFVDNDNSPSKVENCKKSSVDKGLKATFQKLKRSISREFLVNDVKSSPGKSDNLLDATVAVSTAVDEPVNKMESDADSLQDINVKIENESSVEDATKSVVKRKRKRTEAFEDKSDHFQHKQIKSLSEKLMSCVSGKSEDKIDLKGLKEEFGDAIMQEIKGEHGLPEESSVSSSSKETKYDSFHKDKIQNDQPFKSGENTWITEDSLIVFSGKNLECKEKVACFDLDSTIICTKSGRIFPTGPDDWKLLFGNIKKKMKQLQDLGFKIVIFTNQKGLGKFQVSVDEFKHKIEKIQALLEVPIQCFIAKSDDQFRKPVTGMWDKLCSKFNGNEQIDVAQSLYVGDAAGRPAGWTKGRKKDFSCADRCFAANIGLKFHTPEEFFLNWGKSSFSWPAFNPNSLRKSPSLLHPDCTGAELSKKTQEIIVVVGCPASGKSTISKKHFVSNGYEHVNRDTLGTWQKCVAACQSAVSQGKSVIIDNTNPDKKTRQRYIEVAKSEKISIRCCWIMTSIESSLHNNKFRELTTTDKGYKHVGKIAFNIYKSSFEEPRIAEGFQEIVKVNFVPHFDNKKNEKLYFSYLV